MTTNGKRQVRAPTFKWVRLGRMKVAPVGHGQREQKARRVNHLLADFDIDQFGVPVLSEEIVVSSPPLLYYPPPLIEGVLPRRADFGGVLEAFRIIPPP